eukprot:2113050-Prymnesium_polylepis.1
MLSAMLKPFHVDLQQVLQHPFCSGWVRLPQPRAEVGPRLVPAFVRFSHAPHAAVPFKGARGAEGQPGMLAVQHLRLHGEALLQAGHPYPGVDV